MIEIAPAAFAQSLAAARKAETEAAHALSLAVANATISAELQEIALVRDPAGWAKVLLAASEAAASLPALREAAKAALNTLSEIEQHACLHCSGTGTYSGPSRATRAGHTYCFQCNGTGDSRVRPAARRAARV